MNRPLSTAQHSRLDRLAEDHPEATVVGWVGTNPGGPVIKYRDTFRVINVHGRIVPTTLPKDLAGVNL